jgi:hypothetical protein
MRHAMDSTAVYRRCNVWLTLIVCRVVYLSIRNEVWRYDRKLHGTRLWRAWGLMAPGMLYGLAMFAVVVLCEETILKDKKDGHSSHH